jgi:hypothetical protein
VSADLAEFVAWPKTPRMFRDMIVTEKIDGTNAAVMVRPLDWIGGDAPRDHETVVVRHDEAFAVGAQSRKQLIRPGKGTDNYGFAQWVHERADQLVELLGPGRHFGEWWGKSIQRGYGMPVRGFSLFNVHRHAGRSEAFDDGTFLTVVPTLYQGQFSSMAVRDCAEELHLNGSVAAPGFKDPEGIIVFHVAANRTFKYTLDGDGHKEARAE